MLNPKYSLPYGGLPLAWTARSDAKIARRNCYYLVPRWRKRGRGGGGEMGQRIGVELKWNWVVVAA